MARLWRRRHSQRQRDLKVGSVAVDEIKSSSTWRPRNVRPQNEGGMDSDGLGLLQCLSCGLVGDAARVPGLHPNTHVGNRQGEDASSIVKQGGGASPELPDGKMRGVADGSSGFFVSSHQGLACHAMHAIQDIHPPINSELRVNQLT